LITTIAIGDAVFIHFNLTTRIKETDLMPTIRVEFFEGRTDEQKRAYAKALTEATVKTLGSSPESVDILFYDIKKSDWATGGVLWSDKK
jgi:4-oxalocrotonate tautomerase